MKYELNFTNLLHRPTASELRPKPGELNLKMVAVPQVSLPLAGRVGEGRGFKKMSAVPLLKKHLSGNGSAGAVV